MPSMQRSSTPKGIHGILDHFSDLEDPRVVGRFEYPRETVLVMPWGVFPIVLTQPS
jgi:hypothetical protein